MDFHLPNGVSGSLHRPIHLLDSDPTPLDEAVYIPSVTPGYAVAAYKQDWKRDLPEGVGPGDCPSSDNLRHFVQFSKGGSGSSGLEFKRLGADAASVWS